MVIGTSLNYLRWIVGVFNHEALWLSIPFLMTSIFLVTMLTIAVINNWTQKKEEILELTEFVPVGIIIPIYGERVDLLWNTLVSVFAQEYPWHMMYVYVTDDSRRAEVRDVVDRFIDTHPGVQLFYHQPGPHRDNKAGNMNSCLHRFRTAHPEIRFLETRDCDDLVPDKRFLSASIAKLLDAPRTAFVQSIKVAQVSTGDPFGNQESTFYRASMFARSDSNSVFPCGSGVVYRMEALIQIGGFDITGPVEDLRTGYRLLRQGWDAAYLPLIGAEGQIAPEDIPNVFKQRGTWALDTQSLLFWQSPLVAKGLSIRQRLHFLELNMFYMFSFFAIYLMLVPIVSLFFGIYPVVTTHLDYALNFWPWALSIELFLITMVRGLSYESLWRSRQIWLGLAPVFAKATFQALILGPNKKPKYTVTRKEHAHGVYLKETAFQWVLTILLIAGIAKELLTRNVFLEADLGSIMWAGFFVLNLSAVTLGSIRGVNLITEFKELTMQQVFPRPVFRLRKRTAVAVIFIVSLLASCAAQAHGQNLPTPTPSPPTVQQSATTPLGVGVFYDDFPYSDFQEIAGLEKAIGHKVQFVLWFQAWGEGDKVFYADKIKIAQSKGMIPVITWEPWKRDFEHANVVQPEFSLQSIAEGKLDEYIKSWAQGAKEVGGPMIIRFGHEMATPIREVQWYPWQGDPVNYVKAYRHIYDVFKQEGATNVTWLWSAQWLDLPNTWMYYPGDEYVDIIGTTVLNHGTVPDWSDWRPFPKLFIAQYDVAKKYGKPIILTEVASAEQGGSKATWFVDMFRTLKTTPLVKAIFLLERPDFGEPDINWSVQSSPAALAAFRKGIANR